MVWFYKEDYNTQCLLCKTDENIRGKLNRSQELFMNVKAYMIKAEMQNKNAKLNFLEKLNEKLRDGDDTVQNEKEMDLKQLKICIIKCCQNRMRNCTVHGMGKLVDLTLTQQFTSYEK